MQNFKTAIGLGNRIKAIRGETHQEDFAQRAGISVRTLIKLESGQPVKLSGILRIAENSSLSEADTLELVADWIKAQIGPLAESFRIETKAREKNRAPIADRLTAKINALPERIKENLLKAIERPEVLQSLRHLNAAYERIHE